MNKIKDNQQPSFVEYYGYLVYSNGEVFSTKTKRFLKGKIDNSGYKMYALAIGDRISKANNRKLSKMVYAHRLVAMLFLNNPNNLPHVHHKDGNRLNNCVENLEWVTAKQNMENVKKDRQNARPRYFEKNLEGEEWMIIPENLNYSVSSKGRVRNNRTNRLLKIDESQKYSRIQIGKRHYYIHRLVYCVFHNDYNLEDYVIDHIDHNPRNNCLNNLQKITQSENCLRQRRFND